MAIELDTSRQTAFAFGDLPGRLRPMIPTPSFEPFDSPRWIFEPLRGGLRTIAFFDGKRTRLQVGEDMELAETFPEIGRALADAVSVDGVVLDGELIARDRYGTPKLDLVLNRLKTKTAPAKSAVTFHVWDILYQGYRPVMDKSLARRKEILLKTVRATEIVQPTLFRENGGIAFYEAAVSLGMEGVFARHKDGLYLQGKRSQQWLSVRERRIADVVICGYTVAQGKRSQEFESLLLGVYDGERMCYVGTVAGGFDKEQKTELSKELVELQSVKSPFGRPPRVGKLLYWCKPKLVMRVMFGELDRSGQLLFPKFAGLRQDISARDCTFLTIPGTKPLRPKSKGS